MNKFTRDLVKRSGVTGCVFDVSIRDEKKAIADLRRRINLQKKALAKGIERGWSGNDMIQQSITRMETALKNVTEA